MSEYRSYGSFAPIYTHARRELYERLYPDQARRVQCVLEAMAEHCSPIGTCYPGPDKLMELTHYGFGTVKRALLELGKLDWIREHKEFSVVRQRELVTYQISPRVIWISPNNIDMAEQLWNSGSSYSNVMFNGQPTPESESEPTTGPRNRTRIRTTTTTYDKSAQKAQSDSLKPASLDASAHSANQEQYNVPINQRVAPSSTTENVPPPPSIGSCRNPLPSDYAEALAQKLAGDLGTRIAQARQLIKQFDTAQVETALRWLNRERENRTVTKPFGLLKWWLQNQAILPHDEPKEESLTGRYGEFFER